MAELRQKIDDAVIEGLTQMAKKVNMKSPLRVTRQDLINYLLGESVKQYQAGTLDVTALMILSQGQIKDSGDLSSSGREKIRSTIIKKKADSALEMV